MLSPVPQGRCFFAVLSENSSGFQRGVAALSKPDDPETCHRAPVRRTPEKRVPDLPGTERLVLGAVSLSPTG